MQSSQLPFQQDFYGNLEIISGIKFTRREIDIIACILSGRGRKTSASLLSIAEKTVETHTHNIMIKLGCTSHESIREKIEKSDKFLLLKNYYSSLLIEEAFKKSLNDISRLKQEKVSGRLAIYYEDQILKDTLVNYIKDYLEKAGIKSDVIEESSNQITKNDEEKSILVFTNKKDEFYTSKTLQGFSFIKLVGSQNYYFAILEILKELLPTQDVNEIVCKFQSSYASFSRGEFTNLFNSKNGSEISSVKEDLQNYNSEDFKKNEKKFSLVANFLNISASLLTIFFIILGYITFKWEENTNINYNSKLKENNLEYIRKIQSNFILPSETNLLNRPKLIFEIDESLKGTQGIQTLALVGISGAGKTTLARQYGLLQTLAIIWEINSETRESIINSFESLAVGLARTEKDKKILKEFRDIRNVSNRESKIMDFVKQKLKRHSPWLLIYDNFENSENFHQYLPNDPNIWGNGKLIITARDGNIANNKYIKNTLFVKELDDQEKTILFSKILANDATTLLTSAQKDQIKYFLRLIPPFPLDVVAAAYYLRVTNISLEKYIKHLESNDNKFVKLQESILKKSDKYSKNRYSIITLAIKDLIEYNKDFISLFLFISLLDSHSIPRSLLSLYKSDIVVDEFMYYLKKYSLINNHISNLGRSSAFSIHPSIQHICLSYLTKTLPKGVIQNLVASMGSSLENYADRTISSENIDEINLLSKSLNNFLSRELLLTDKIKSSLAVELGRTYFYLGNYNQAKLQLEESRPLLDRCYNKSDLKAIHALRYLGVIYRELGEYAKAKIMLEESFNKYRQYFPENYKDMASNAAQLGNTYRSLGDYEKAKNFLEKSLSIYAERLPQNFLDAAWASIQLANVYRSLGKYNQAKALIEESIHIYKHYLPEDHIKMAWSQVHLANIYRNMGKYEEAKSLLQESLIVYKKYFSPSHLDIAWATIQLAKVYEGLGDYKRALCLLEESLATYKRHFKEDHKKVAWVLLQIGIIYKSLGRYEAAKDFLEKSLISYKKHYGKMHPKAARILNILGQTYLLKGNVEMAEKLLQNALQILSTLLHPDKVVTLEGLGEICIKKSEIATNNGDILQANSFTKKALEYFEEAQGIAKRSFSQKSLKLKNLQYKIKNLKMQVQLG
jgi:tetratricopeptide (TPR) repeat protein